MANNIFSNDSNDAPECTICQEKVVDRAERSITKLLCGHFFHTDCIGSKFNANDRMNCPNCAVIEEEYEDEDEDDEESNDEDEYNDGQPSTPQGDLDLLATAAMYDGGASNIRHDMNVDDQGDNGRNMFTYTPADIELNELIERSRPSWAVPPPPPPPIAPDTVDQRKVSSLDSNTGSDPVNREASTSYRPLSLADILCTSLGDQESQQFPCQCIYCRSPSS